MYKEILLAIDLNDIDKVLPFRVITVIDLTEPGVNAFP